MAETEKMTKIGFRPWPKSKKRQKERFGRGRNWKNAENYISNPVEMKKMPQNDFIALRET